MKNGHTSLRQVGINSKQIAAYFDFDGTLTDSDTLIPFLIYVVGYWRFSLKLHKLLPILFAYALKIISNETAKEKTLTVLLKGYSIDLLEKKARQFAEHKLDGYLKPDVYSKLEYHIEHKHTIILVSANLAIYLRYWAQRHHIDAVIATEIEVINSYCTGKLKTRNCYGKQKIRRINEYSQLNNKRFRYSYGYGNSRGDYELLIYVDEGYWISGVEITPWADFKVDKKH